MDYLRSPIRGITKGIVSRQCACVLFCQTNVAVWYGGDFTASQYTSRQTGNPTMAVAFLRDYPKAERAKEIKVAISPFDTEVAAELAPQDHLEDLTLIVPSEKGDCHSRPRGIGYHLIQQMLNQWDKLPRLKTATIRAKNKGTGMVKWPKHAPPQIVMGLSARALDELAFERTELPVEAPYPAKLFGSTQCGKLVFWETHMWLTEELYGDMVGVELSKSVESLEFLDINDNQFVTWVLGLVPQGRNVAVKYRHRGREHFSPFTWRALKPNLACINSLEIELGGFLDSENSIWDDLSASTVRELRLERPTYTRRAFENFLKYIETGPLESLRISGRVDVTDVSRLSPRDEQLNPTRELLNAVAKSNIQWLSFPYTDCGVGAAIAEAVPHLKVEVLDVGLFPPSRHEKNPAKAMVDSLKANKTIGKFKNEVRKKVALELGIYGLTVRSVVPDLWSDGKPVKDDERDWAPLTYSDMELAAFFCRRNMDEYYHEISVEE